MQGNNVGCRGVMWDRARVIWDMGVKWDRDEQCGMQKSNV